jgi:hypothetical protein
VTKALGALVLEEHGAADNDLSTRFFPALAAAADRVLVILIWLVGVSAGGVDEGKEEGRESRGVWAYGASGAFAMGHCCLMVAAVVLGSVQGCGIDVWSRMAPAGVQVMEEVAGSMDPLGWGRNIPGLTAGGLTVSNGAVGVGDLLEESGKGSFAGVNVGQGFGEVMSELACHGSVEEEEDWWQR